MTLSYDCALISLFVVFFLTNASHAVRVNKIISIRERERERGGAISKYARHPPWPNIVDPIFRKDLKNFGRLSRVFRVTWKVAEGFNFVFRRHFFFFLLKVT